MKIKAKLLKCVWAVMLIPAYMVFFPSCEEYKIVQEEVNPEEPVYFQNQIQPIFTDNCIVCHKGSRDPDLRNGYSYESLTTGGYVNKPAEDSRLYRQVTSSSHSSLTTDTEKQLIFTWIDQGAKNN